MMCKYTELDRENKAYGIKGLATLFLSRSFRASVCAYNHKQRKHIYYTMWWMLDSISIFLHFRRKEVIVVVVDLLSSAFSLRNGVDQCVKGRKRRSEKINSP